MREHPYRTATASTHTFPYNPTPGLSEGNPPTFFASEPSTTREDLRPNPHLVSTLPYLEGDLTVSKEMWIIPLATRDKTALSLNLHQRTSTPGLGMLDWGLVSDAVTVGGLAKFWCNIQNTDPAATIWSVRLSINQGFALKSPRRPEEDEVAFPPNELAIFKTGSLPRNQEERYVLPNNKGHASHKQDMSMEPLWEGELVARPDTTKLPVNQLKISETVRMPDENRLRPSTCPG
jgi:hypothetical protein